MDFSIIQKQDAAMLVVHRNRLRKLKKHSKRKILAGDVSKVYTTAEVRKGKGGEGGRWGKRRGASFEQPPASRRSVNKVRSSLGELGLNSNHNNKVNRVIPVC